MSYNKISNNQVSTQGNILADTNESRKVRANAALLVAALDILEKARLSQSINKSSTSGFIPSGAKFNPTRPKFIPTRPKFIPGGSKFIPVEPFNPYFPKKPHHETGAQYELAFQKLLVAGDPEGYIDALSKFMELIYNQSEQTATQQELEKLNMRREAFTKALEALRNADQAQVRAFIQDYFNTMKGQLSAVRQAELKGELKDISKGDSAGEKLLKKEQKAIRQAEEDIASKQGDIASNQKDVASEKEKIAEWLSTIHDAEKETKKHWWDIFGDVGAGATIGALYTAIGCLTLREKAHLHDISSDKVDIAKDKEALGKDEDSLNTTIENIKHMLHMHIEQALDSEKSSGSNTQSQLDGYQSAVSDQNSIVNSLESIVSGGVL